MKYNKINNYWSNDGKRYSSGPSALLGKLTLSHFFFKHSVFIGELTRDPRQSPFQIGQHEFKRFGPLFFGIELDFHGIRISAAGILDFSFVHSIRKTESRIALFHLLLELLKTIEKRHHRLSVDEKQMWLRMDKDFWQNLSLLFGNTTNRTDQWIWILTSGHLLGYEWRPWIYAWNQGM